VHDVLTTRAAVIGALLILAAGAGGSWLARGPRDQALRNWRYDAWPGAALPVDTASPDPACPRAIERTAVRQLLLAESPVGADGTFYVEARWCVKGASSRACSTWETSHRTRGVTRAAYRSA
jgi:hypothetical protein